MRAGDGWDGGRAAGGAAGRRVLRERSLRGVHETQGGEVEVGEEEEEEIVADPPPRLTNFIGLAVRQ